MNIFQYIRKKTGRIKCVVFDQWPYLRSMKSIPRLRQTYLQYIEKLPALPEYRENRYEIHMLCGHRDVDMGIWASWSILRFLDGFGKLYVHSDGTLTDMDALLWRKVVGGMVVVDRTESDQKIKKELSSRTKILLPWRFSNWASAQLVDVHYFGNSPTLLIMDSDVLTFSRPQEVMDALTAVDPSFAWCRDLRNSYSYTPEVIYEITGVRVPRRLCAGFLVSPRLTTEDFIQLDHQMQQIEKTPDVSVGMNDSWACQTYYALIASRFSNSKILSTQYSNITGRVGDQQVLRHYVGIPMVRFRYFTEGLPRILRQVGLLGS
jgi:hypothetical protein